MGIPFLSKWIEPQRTYRVLWQSLIAWAGIALLTYCAFNLRINPLAVSSLYFLAVVAMASSCGFWQASLTSLVAVACLDYFFMPPLFHFNVLDQQDWVALATFEVTALVISRLSAKELRSARDAAFHRTWMGQLYELSRDSLWMDLHQPPGPQLVVLIQRIFGARAVALFDKNLGRQDSVGEWGVEEQTLAQECCLLEMRQDDRESETSKRVLQAASGTVGALIVRGKMNPLVVDALASLSAIAIDRHQWFEKEEKADAARKGEQLRAAVMDALGHEFKTPLTTIQTASSGLLEIGGLTDLQGDLAKLIDDQAVRLSELCTRLLTTAKLESQQVGLRAIEVKVKALISEILESRLTKEARDRIEASVDDPALVIWVDRGLLAMILTQYIDNALKYSTPGTPIKIGVQVSHTEVIISVHNLGSPIRMEDRERIFDRFFRAEDFRESVPGTGIGLSVARKAAETHHGHVWVISDDKEGTTFFLSLPLDSRRRH
ncbi:MAG: ATP-binding protein [Terracidiphilus sp.]|jgi:two-component system sensor histidine kinase KdpD